MQKEVILLLCRMQDLFSIIISPDLCRSLFPTLQPDKKFYCRHHGISFMRMLTLHCTDFNKLHQQSDGNPIFPFLHCIFCKKKNHAISHILFSKLSFTQSNPGILIDSGCIDDFPENQQKENTHHSTKHIIDFCNSTSSISVSKIQIISCNAITAVHKQINHKAALFRCLRNDCSLYFVLGMHNLVLHICLSEKKFFKNKGNLYFLF